VPAADATTAAMLLQGLAGNASFVATVSPPLYLRVTITAPTAAVPGTELVSAGYIHGGLACPFAAATTTASGAIMSNSSALSWTNGSGSPWNIVGWELYDNLGVGARKLYGLWDSQPLVVGPGSPLNVAIGALSITIPLFCYLGGPSRPSGRCSIEQLMES
jgi:hypothetical protein